MHQLLPDSSPETIAAYFCAAYVLAWMFCTNDWLWVVVASSICFLFLRFSFSLSEDQRDTLPPVSMLVALFHWAVAYVFVTCNFK